MFKKVLLFLSISFFLGLSTHAQVVVPESVKRRCENIPFNDKVRLAVATFKMTAKGGARNDNIANLSKMLSNAMFEIECFRMLDLIEDLNKYTPPVIVNGQTKAAAPVTPQLIITGDITEYNHTSEEIKIKVPLGGGKNLGSRIKNEAHIGFVMQIVHPSTREILFSKSFNQSASKQTVRTNSYNASQSIDAIYQDAMEKGILDAVTYIVDNRDRIYEEAGILSGATGNATGNAPAPQKTSTYTLEVLGGASFATIQDIEHILSNETSVTEISKKYTSSRGTFSIAMTGTVDDIAAILERKLKSVKYEVIGFEDTRLTINVQ